MNKSDRKIYLLEDDSLLGLILLEQFKLSGFDIKVITSGNEALSTIRETPPDLLILDLFIPDIYGLDLLEILRKEEATKNLKVIVVSNSDQQEARVKAKELNAKFFIKAITNPSEIVKKAKEELGIE